jgi:N-acetylmuramoyl-L-alanine amidase
MNEILVTNKQFALVVGHNSINQGADNYLGESEYSFNYRIAETVARNLAMQGVRCLVFKHNPLYFRYNSQQWKDVADRVKEVNIDHAIILHFNSFSQPVSRTEALCIHTESNIEMARIFLDNMEGAFFFQGKEVKIDIEDQAIARGEIESDYFHKKGINSIIAEPVFGNFKTKESELFFKNESLYCKVLQNTIKEILIPDYKRIIGGNRV